LDPTTVDIALRLGAALAAGSLIGLERTFHGRPAGFRTHALVCLASALLMLMTSFQWEWLETPLPDSVQADPARMAQGIMTGIGFLGAGVIFKEGLTVRGLTTAASIWITAALGIVYGAGFYLPAVLATIATLGTLAAFRWIEDRLPKESFWHVTLRFAVGNEMSEADMRQLLVALGFRIEDISYRLEREGAVFEYRIVISSLKRDTTSKLAEQLKSTPEVVEFLVQPASD
jgi:putative Mg2+ transporter-C (MgtC) family protein